MNREKQAMSYEQMQMKRWKLSNNCDHSHRLGNDLFRTINNTLHWNAEHSQLGTVSGRVNNVAPLPVDSNLISLVVSPILPSFGRFRVDRLRRL